MSELSDLEHVIFRNGDVRLHAVVAGPADGPAILLLHGFPEFWYCWRKQITSLAAAGFRVIAPDQRGYNTSSKPKKVSQYAMCHLVSDVVAIIDQVGRPTVCLAGHDWGAMVAWSVAAWRPEKIERMAILNVPHPSVMLYFLLTRPAQLLKSWYMFFFQIPWVPEMLLSAGNFRAACRSLVETSRPGTFLFEDLQQYRAAWAQPGAVRAMINWYRALFTHPIFFRSGKITVPTRILWGKKDAFLVTSLALASQRQCKDAEVIFFENASHWLHLEEPDAVNAAILDFFKPAK